MGETEYSVDGEPFGENEAQIRANMGGTAWAAPENQAENPSYVLAPQMRGAWNGEEAVALIKEVIAAYPDIDEDRIYIAGCSMGGMGTWDTILADPDLFAAAMPICPARAPSEEELATLVDLPIWIFQAANDTTVRPCGRSRFICKAHRAWRRCEIHRIPRRWNLSGHTGHGYLYSTTITVKSMRQAYLTDAALDCALDFDIVAEVFEYGQNTTALIVDAGRDVNGSTIAADTFKVSAINYNPSNGREAFNGERKVTNAYVSADAIVDGVADAAGRYIIIELEHGYNVRGATTLAYTGRNIELDMNYSIEQLKAYEFADGTAAEGLTYNQDGIINISVDNFMFGVGECGLEYRFFTPNRESGEKYPLVVWVHGGGEAGDNNTAQVLANMGATAWADPENQAENPSYVLAPQSPGAWDGEKVVALVKEIISTHPDIDTTRVYVLGCSMGGAGTWNTIFADPDLFAAAMPICAALNPTEEQLATIADIPIWIIHAENDPTVPVANSREPFAKLQAMGVDVKYTEFENVDPYMGHWSWIPVLNNFYSEEYGTNVFDWLYSQKNESYKLVTEVLPYGQDVTAIVIDTQNDVAAADLSIENAKVYAENYKTDGSVAFDGERNITDIYVNNTGAKGDRSDYGRYIVIELEYGYGVSGATTHYYTGRNYYLDLNYDVDLTVGNYNFDTNYDQGETENLVVDDFEYIEYDGTFFRLYTPEEAGQGEALPLVVWNHGAGETYGESNGQDNEAMQIVANQGGVGFVVNNDEYPCYVLAPQRGTGTNYSREKVISFIDDLAAEGLVDNNRVYVAGCSAGGGETISFLKEYPQYFAAAVPICAAGQLSDANMAEITDIPVWFIHAANDPTVGVDSTRDKFERFTALDPYDVRYAEYEGVFGPDGFEYPNGHWSWIMFLANDYVEEYETTFFDWMFAQSKADVEEYTETAGENEAISFNVSTTDDVIGLYSSE